MSRNSVQILGEAAALAALEGPWWELWRRSPNATPFQSPAWLLPWWRAFSPGRLATAALWRKGRLLALLPLYVEPGPDPRMLPIGIGTSDYLDMLIDPESAPPALSLLLPALAREVADWRCCRFEELPPDAAAFRLPSAGDFIERLECQSACPVLDPARPLPAEVRRSLRRAVRRAEASGRLAILRIGPDETDGFLARLFVLHGQRWRQAGEAGVLADSAVRRFHRDAVALLAQAGLVRLYEYRLNGQVLAAYYGLIDRGRAYAYIGGYDPEFAALSPGSVLLAHAIDEARREGATEFHLLRGREAYKYKWGAVDRWNRCREIVRGVSDAAG
ncbi:MAG TPA: GNAT family N-acetyltransferase [Stellaceae bacterium]